MYKTQKNEEKNMMLLPISLNNQLRFHYRNLLAGQGSTGFKIWLSGSTKNIYLAFYIRLRTHDYITLKNEKWRGRVEEDYRESTKLSYESPLQLPPLTIQSLSHPLLWRQDFRSHII